jgi:signal transduction histidine kinase
MSISISDPAWDYNYDGVKTIGDSFFQDIEVALLVVRDNVAGELYNNEVHGKAYTTESLLMMNREIVYDGEKIGTLTVGLTKYYRLQTIYNMLKFSVLQLLVSLITLMVIVYMISHQITKPLSLLELDVKRLAEGKERIKTHSYSDDEIGRLAHSFNDMGDIIEESSQKLHEINNSLEETVHTRTEELLNKNEELNKTLVALKETQNQLLKSSKQKLTTRLVSGVAHEINTPLGLTITIITYMEDRLKELKTKFNSGEVDQGQFNKITDEIFNASKKLENNLKRVSQLMDHFRELMLENQNQTAITFNVLDHLLKTRKSLLIDLMKKNIVFEVICDDHLEICSYPTALLQIITHLTENAIRHGFEGLNEGTIRLVCEGGENELSVIFSDNGKGMNSDMLSHVFTPFFKGSTRQSGSGLGLAIVENIVNVHLGGSIRCSSQINQGTTFEIRIPIEDSNCL